MKKIMVVTSTRADYGLLRPVIKRINESDKLELSLVVTGAHLSAKYGNTVEEIRQDGFPIACQVQIIPQEKSRDFQDKPQEENKGIGQDRAFNGGLESDKNTLLQALKSDNLPTKNEVKISKGNSGLESGENTGVKNQTIQIMSDTLKLFSQVFEKEKPDLVLVLGDRYEIFAVATTAATMSVPLAHISGGDVTTGAKDDFYRHCITKMSNLHFPSCVESRKRVIQLGENPDTVFNVGGLGDENIRNTELLSLEELEQSLNFSPLAPFLLITYHPETQKNSSATQEMKKLLDALDKTTANLIFTKSNADQGGSEINDLIDEYCTANPNRAKAFFSLGLKRYLSAIKYCAAVVGNSSSGVVETPTFGVPCVNIGDRQKGRYIAENVICAKSEREDIEKALSKALSKEFTALAKKAKSPYYNHCVPSEEIVRHITEFVYENKNTIKFFYDL
ncbi:MAG: UDP-N-acetylglucosamine 2-epimerase [Oscillospiraceae bacterium]